MPINIYLKSYIQQDMFVTTDDAIVIALVDHHVCADYMQHAHILE